MTPWPEPFSRGGTSDNKPKFFARSSGDEEEDAQMVALLGGGREYREMPRAMTMSSTSSSSTDDSDDGDIEEEVNGRQESSTTQSQEVPAFATGVHPRHPYHVYQEQDEHEQKRHGPQNSSNNKSLLPAPSFSLSIPVSRSSSSASLSSVVIVAPPTVALSSLADLEEGTLKHRHQQHEQQQQPLLLGHEEKLSPSKTKYLRRRRKLRSFVSFAPALLLRSSLDRRRQTQHSAGPWSILPPTVAMPLLNGIDMFAVSLVVPLLFQYYKAAGVTSAGQRELLSSVFSASQIVGGLMLGVLTDANLVERKTILLLSFGGSAFSYGLIAVGGLNTLLLSRVMVGLVKHTMTVCTTILTHHTTKENRARGLGRLTASSTVAWVIGPTVGALLYRYFDPRAPVFLACLLFAMNFVLAWVLVDHDHPTPTDNGDSSSTTKDPSASKPPQSKFRVILTNLKCCFGSRALGSAVATKLLLGWINRATSYTQLGSFYEDMYNLQPHHRGYISSYQQLVQLAANVRLISPVLEWAGGERRATLYCVAITAAAVWLESLRSLPLFLVVLCPVISLAYSISDLSVQTLVTHVAPPSGMFSVLAAMDVLQSAASVSVPFYRTWLFGHLPRDASEGAMEGDPDPVAWVQASSLHWLLAAIVLSFALTRESWWVEDHVHHLHKGPTKKGK